MKPTEKEEIAIIGSSVNSNKTSGPNNIPDRMLYLQKTEFLKQLADLFILFFMSGVFSLVLKTAKVVPVFKKDSKLDYSNYRPISLSSNTGNYLKNRCMKDCIPFSAIILSITYSLDSDNDTLHLVP